MGEVGSVWRTGTALLLANLQKIKHVSKSKNKNPMFEDLEDNLVLQIENCSYNIVSSPYNMESLKSERKFIFSKSSTLKIIIFFLVFLNFGYFSRAK